MCERLCSKPLASSEPASSNAGHVVPVLSAAPSRKEGQRAVKGRGRREFLKATGTTIATLALSGFFPRLAHASWVWGDIPPSIWSTTPDLKVLEIHLLGGVAPFESFYFRPPLGIRTRGFDAEITGLTWNGACANTPSGLQTDSPF